MGPPFIGAGIEKYMEKVMAWRLMTTLVASRPRQFSCPKAIDMRDEKKWRHDARATVAVQILQLGLVGTFAAKNATCD
jgi:hypothetical protein